MLTRSVKTFNWSAALVGYCLVYEFFLVSILILSLSEDQTGNLVPAESSSVARSVTLRRCLVVRGDPPSVQEQTPKSQAGAVTPRPVPSGSPLSAEIVVNPVDNWPPGAGLVRLPAKVRVDTLTVPVTIVLVKDRYGRIVKTLITGQAWPTAKELLGYD